METKTVVSNNGVVRKYKMTREKGFFTSHIWVYLNGKPYLHVMPTDTGTGKIFKNCEKYGYLPMCELMVNFEDITLNELINY